jgi:hypothetical protein
MHQSRNAGSVTDWGWRMKVTPITSLRPLTALPLPALSAKLFYSVCYLRDGPAVPAAPVGLERFPVEPPSPTVTSDSTGAAAATTSTAVADGISNATTAAATAAVGAAAAVVPFMKWPMRFVPLGVVAAAPAGTEQTAELPLHALPDATSAIVAYLGAHDQVGSSKEVVYELQRRSCSIISCWGLPYTTHLQLSTMQ